MEEKTTNLLADLLFAYVNKDEDLPHQFEIDAVEQAVKHLNKNYKGNKYSSEFFNGVLDEIKEKTSI